ncbi:uncharacterized protein LOC107803848 isoform X1 [Nicotiana tabacum]|uniref:Uncharacterized protein LOC107803848 isoform X1 n=1 Tax=Nicotiana tabacum TaxID=4097 RepID=A0A1S4B2G9_TOBAC
MPFYRILRMGCGVSKIDANGVATPNRILPNFPNRRRHKECTPSKKEPLLLMHEIPDEDHANINRHSISAPKCDDNMSCVTSEGSNEKRVAKIMAIVQEEEKYNEGGGVHENEENGGEKDDNNDDDLRAINKLRVDEEDGDLYPSSPSFRVYFTDTDVESNKNDVAAGNNKVGLKDITPVAATISSTKECVVKEEKKEIRKKSFRNVLPRNLLNVRSSSNSSTRSTHHHNTHHPA